MRRIAFILAAISAGMGLPVALAPPAAASWVSQHCSVDHMSDSAVRRIDAKAYAAVAAGEGYEYAGGCWNDNDRDDTPGQPDSSGEGPDCSGLAFKSWELRNSWGASGATWWNKLENVHGPYASFAFHDPGPGLPSFLVSKSRASTIYMDAFARAGRIGLLWTNAGPSAGTDYIIEAKGDAWGTGIFEENYRSDADYHAVRREGWSPDCAPRCGAVAAVASVGPTVVVP